MKVSSMDFCQLFYIMSTYFFFLPNIFFNKGYPTLPFEKFRWILTIFLSMDFDANFFTSCPPTFFFSS